MTIESNVIYQKTVTMITEICCKCGVPFGIPSDLQEHLKADSNKYFYCPNGHSQHYSKSTANILREQIETQKQRHQRELEIANNKFLDEMNSRRKVERQLKRVHKGTCPCCSRSFTNLERHMKTKHPDITPSKIIHLIHTKINSKQKINK